MGSVNTVKKHLIRILLWCMTVMLAMGGVCAEQAAVQPERVRVLLTQGTGTSAKPAELAAALAVMPELGFDYALYYDETHIALCDLTQAVTYAERSAAFDGWLDSIQKSRTKNITHASAWDRLYDLTLGSAAEIVWLPAEDIAPTKWADVSALISGLTAQGSTLRLYTDFTTLNIAASAERMSGVQVLSVADRNYEVMDSLLTGEGFFHRSGDDIVNILRTAEVHPAGTLPGSTVLVDWCPTYQIVGSTFTYGSVSIGGGDTDDGMAVTYTTASGEAETQPMTEAQLPANGLAVEASSEGYDVTLSAIAQTHQLCWYFKPAPDSGVVMTVSPDTVPYSTEAEVTFTLTLAPAVETALAQQICAADLTAEDAAFTVAASVTDAVGVVTPVTLTPAQNAGEYTFTLGRKEGAYTVNAAVSISGMPFTYPAMNAFVTMQAPLPVVAAGYIAAIELNAAPMLWHGGETEATIVLSDLFRGSYLPVTLYNTAEDVLSVAVDGETYTLTALKEGSAQLFFLSRDGVTGTVVPVNVANGQKPVLMELGAALILLFAILYTVIISRVCQPRFRKGEKLEVVINGCETFALPADRYAAKGVSLWRLLVVSGRANTYKDDKSAFKAVVIRPKRSGVIIREGKNSESFVAECPQQFRIGDNEFSVTLKATDPNA